MNELLEPYRRNNPVQQILGRIRYAGMKWHVTAGELHLSGAIENFADSHRADINTHRSAIVAALESLPPDCPTPHMCFDMGCLSGTCDQAESDHERKDAA